MKSNVAADDRAGKKRLGWVYYPAAVLLLGALSLGMLVWTDDLDQRQRAGSLLADTLHDLRTRAATSHLWLEEAISGGERGPLERAWADLSEAIRLSQVLLEGGVSTSGYTLPPLTDAPLRRRAEEIQQLLAEMRRTAGQRVETRAGVGSALDRHFNAIFDELETRAEDLQRALDENQLATRLKSRRLFYGMLIAWSSILGISLTGLVWWERRRRQAEEGVRRAKDELETRVAERTAQLNWELNERKKTAESLRESEEQLRRLSAGLELRVQERTAELAAANTLLSELSGGLMHVQDEERRRIARDLHEGTAQMLVGLAMNLKAALRLASREDRRVRAAIEVSLDLVEQSSSQVQTMAYLLHPPGLDEFGLAPALSWYVEGFGRRSGIEVAVNVSLTLQRLEHDLEVAIFRIVQEALTNILRHSSSRTASISLQQDPSEIVLKISDQGHGIPDDVLARIASRLSMPGIGIAGMRERARQLGGALEIESTPQGVRLIATLPLRHAQPAASVSTVREGSGNDQIPMTNDQGSTRGS